jgi:hypothetical protein
MNRVIRAACAVTFFALGGLGLAACSGSSTAGTGYTCPAATTVPDLQTLARLSPNGADQNIQAAGRIASVSSTCDKEDAGVATYLSIQFAALRTSPNIQHVDLPYFVAIADSTGNILGKQQFSIGVDFPSGVPTVRTTEKVTAHLPLHNAQLGNVYTVIVGFQLTKNELDFNRAHQQ